MAHDSQSARDLSPANTFAAAPIPADWVSITAESATGCDNAANESAPRVVQCPIAATRADGSAYGGDLIPDVLEYRRLRWRSLRGELMTTKDTRRFTALEGKLRQADDGGEASALRMFYRYDCSFPARILFTDAHGAPQASDVTVQDMSAGGVKLGWSHSLDAGERVELVVALGSSVDLVRFPGRVAWTRSGALGLMFAGAAAG